MIEDWWLLMLGPVLSKRTDVELIVISNRGVCSGVYLKCELGVLY